MATYTYGPVPCTGVDTTTGLSEFMGRVILDVTQDVTSNRSTINSWRFEIYINRPEYISNLTANYNNKVTVDFVGKRKNGAETVTETKRAFYSDNATQVHMHDHYSSTSTKPGSLGPLVLAQSGSSYVPITFEHSDNGDLTLGVNAVYTKDLAYIKSISVIEDKAMPSIPRSAAIDSVTDVDFGQYPTIKWTPANTNYWYKVSYSFDDVTVTSEVLKPTSTSQYTYNSLQVPTEWIPRSPNSQTATVTANLETFSDSGGTTSIGSSSKTFTATVPDTPAFQPSATLSLNPINPYVAQSTPQQRYYIQGRTSFGYSLGGYTKSGATLRTFNFVATDSSGNVVYSYTGTSSRGVVPVFNAPGAATFTLTAIDSRGMTGTATITETITAYSKPTIRASATRGTGTVSGTSCSNFTVDEAEGTVVRITYTVAYTELTLNSVDVSVEKPDGTTQTVPSPQNGGTENAYFSSYNTDNEYEFTIIASDKVSSAADAARTVVEVAPAWYPIDISADGNSIAFHGVAQYRSGNGSAQFYQDVEIQDGNVLKLYDDNGNVRATLDIVNGLRFYNTSGAVIGSYPVNGSS